MSWPIPISGPAAYASKGNIAFPGTAAELTAAQTFAATDIDNHIDDRSGSGITITATTIVAAR